MFQQSLINSAYPTKKVPEEGVTPVQSLDEAKRTMEASISERGFFEYGFHDYWCAFFMKSCCCCIKKDSPRWKRQQFKYQKYGEAVDRLNEEIDILKHLSNQRISTFMAKLVLRKHQRALVHSFRQNMIDDLATEQNKPAKMEKDPNNDGLMNIGDSFADKEV